MNALRRFWTAMRTHLGFGGLSETRLSPAHGWLLPKASNVRGSNPANEN
jgi:hypothetical protein